MGIIRFERAPSSIDALDGLRAFAIILVLLRHGVRPFSQDQTAAFLPVFGWDATIPLLNGWAGVDLFFVLSGFLISSHLIKKAHSPVRSFYGNYIAKRALRIVPSYYVVLVLVAIGAFPGFGTSQDNVGYRLAYHMLFLQDLLPSNFIVAFWSLGVEEKFYILCPFVMIILCRMKQSYLRYLILALLILTPFVIRSAQAAAAPEFISYESFFLQYRSPFYMCFDGLFIGMACAFIYQDRAGISLLKNAMIPHLLFWGGLAGVMMLILPAPLVESGAGWFEKTALQLLLAVCFGALTLGVLLGGGPQRFLSNGVFLVIARLSYTAYLVHMAVIPLGMAMTFIILGGDERTAFSFFVFLPIFGALTVAVSMLIHFGVEKPFMSMRHLIGTAQVKQV